MLVYTPLLLLQVNLVGGYYDAGDNVKFGFPMAFTITMLSWSVIEYGSQMASQGQLGYSLEAIQWGTDYFIKAHPEPNVLYGEVPFLSLFSPQASSSSSSRVVQCSAMTGGHSKLASVCKVRKLFCSGEESVFMFCHCLLCCGALQHSTVC
jgi:hypothetical protein